MKLDRIAMLLLRLYIGYLFLMAGWDKWNDKYTTGDDLEHFLKTRLTACEPNTVSAAVIQRYYIPNTKPLAWLVVVGELCVGAALIMGLATRAACIIGIFMNANFFLATNGSFLSFDNNAVFILVQFALLCSSAGRFMGLDYFLSKKFSNNYLW